MADDAKSPMLASFDDPEMVGQYAEGARKFLPGFDDLHRLTGVLLAERAPETARVLVLGAGGGLELRALADLYPGWTFVGVDPSATMLNEARRAVGPHAARVEFCEGYIDDAPEGPFDAATCLLTLHFLDAEERLRTVTELNRRLRPRAPFVAVHTSFPMTGASRAQWLSRYAGFAVASGVDPAIAEKFRETVDTQASLLEPQQDEAILEHAGFSDVTLFYTAFTWRGWVGYA